MFSFQETVQRIGRRLDRLVGRIMGTAEAMKRGMAREEEKIERAHDEIRRIKFELLDLVCGFFVKKQAGG